MTSPPQPPPTPSPPARDADAARLVRRHLRFGWWALLVFLCLGLTLESLHGFKVGFYLDVENETRRLLFRLAHAHGALLALLNLVFALCVGLRPELASRLRGAASTALIAAGVLLPGGFLLGGLVIYGGDPNPAVLLAALGGLALFVAVLLTAWAQRD
jgi:hypothetical protein